MFYVKNDDMDDLFKKAASEYELNEELASDWNKVQDAISSESEATVSRTTKKRKKRFLFFWWLLFIPVALLVGYETGIFQTEHKNIAAEKNPQKKTEEPSKNKTVESTGSTQNGKNKDLKQDDEQITGTKAATGTDDKKAINKTYSLAGMNTAQVKNIGKSENKNPALDSKSNAVPGTETSNEINQELISKRETKPPINNNNVEGFPETTINKKDTVLTTAADIAGNRPTANSKETSAKTKNKKVNNKDNYTRKNYAFIGLTGNADLSFVKFQKTSNVGFGGGVVAGYHLKNGISFQTGLLYDKKNYYTAGKYFDTKNVPYMQMVNFLNADGNCKMWEIPLNVSYDFKSAKRSNFFVTAGVSSYLMNTEYYNMHYERDGALHEKAYDYKNATKDWFSVLNIGGGINIQTKSKFFIQVQPYYKVPLSGVGTGNLSLSSAGVNLSVMRRLK